MTLHVSTKHMVSSLLTYLGIMISNFEKSQFAIQNECLSNPQGNGIQPSLCALGAMSVDM
jgi:hypothetical protein